MNQGIVEIFHIPRNLSFCGFYPKKIYYYFVICYFVMTSLGADPLYVSVNELREVFSEESRAGGHSSDGAE